jgi:two-component system sensor histidine kinase CpxA
MPIRVPLYGKVLFWFLVNLCLVALLAGAFAVVQLRFGVDWLLAGPAKQRLEAMGEVIAGELRDQPVSAWNELLARYRSAHRVSFTIFRNDGKQVAGTALTPPAEVLEKLQDRRPPAPPPPPPQRQGPGTRDRSGPREHPPAEKEDLDELEGAQLRPHDPPKAKTHFMVRSVDPVRYWVGVHIGLVHHSVGESSRPVTLLLTSSRITGGGLFFDPVPWLLFAVAALGLSALIWLPIVGGITRTIRKFNVAARRISEGCFDVRVPDGRLDELGELGVSVNTMARQLDNLVGSQRRLTADIAHELCSPIARMQRALGIVQQRVGSEHAGYVSKLDRELQHMAQLVEEVLSFTKAGNLPATAVAEDFSIADLVRDVVAREAADAEVRVEVAAGLRVHAIREALDRALANVVRNSVRYASHAGAILITAQECSGEVQISVADSGPGVPADALEKIFEPFYRPEVARKRSTGGAGLGLAIVRRCVEACGGAVSAELCVPQGLRVNLRVPAAAA